MKKVYQQELKVLSTQLDMNAEMGLIGSLQVVQDNMCEFFEDLGCDGITMIPVCNSFFVVTKTKIVFNKNLHWLDKFKVDSQISSKTRIKLNLCTDIVNDLVLGVYCSEPCTCQGCFNKPIHEETVISTRKQIEFEIPLNLHLKSFRHLTLALN